VHGLAHLSSGAAISPWGPTPSGGWRLPSTWGSHPVWRVAATLDMGVPPRLEGGGYPRHGVPPRLEGGGYPRHGVPTSAGGWRLPSPWGPHLGWRVAATLDMGVSPRLEGGGYPRHGGPTPSGGWRLPSSWLARSCMRCPPWSTSRSTPRCEGGRYPRTDPARPKAGCVPWSTSRSTPRLEGGSYPRAGPRTPPIGWQVPSSWPTYPSDGVAATLEMARAHEATVPAMVAARSGPQPGRGGNPGLTSPARCAPVRVWSRGSRTSRRVARSPLSRKAQ
jgi:hypothetical protein